MSIQMIIFAIVIWITPAVLSLIAFAYLIGRISDLGILTADRTQKAMDEIERIRQLEQVNMGEIIENRAVTRDQTRAMENMSGLFGVINEKISGLIEAEKKLANGEIQLPEIEEDREEEK